MYEISIDHWDKVLKNVKIGTTSKFRKIKNGENEMTVNMTNEPRAMSPLASIPTPSPMDSFVKMILSLQLLIILLFFIFDASWILHYRSENFLVEWLELTTYVYFAGTTIFTMIKYWDFFPVCFFFHSVAVMITTTRVMVAVYIELTESVENDYTEIVLWGMKLCLTFFYGVGSGLYLMKSLKNCVTTSNVTSVGNRKC